MENNYWTRKRLSRRALIRGGGVAVAGLGAAALIGCGDDDDDDVGATPTAATQATATPTQQLQEQQQEAEETGILTRRVETSSMAVPGGIFPGIVNAEPENVDPLQATSYKAPYASRWAYPQLLQFKPGVIEPASGEVEGQLAETFEFIEPTKLVLNLRTDAKWDAREPTNSRVVDAEDVVFSWNKFRELSNSRSALSNEVSDLAPVLDITAIDSETVQVDLAFEFGPILNGLAYTRWMQIMPRESDGGYDPRQEIRGAGPWMLSKWDRNLRMEWRRNPNYWNKERPFLDGYDAPVIDEYAQRLAQFRAAAMQEMVVRQEDVIATKEEIKELEVYQGDIERGNWQIYFGLRPDSVWRDERMRRAVSMLIDRDLINDTFYRVSEFEEKGWPTKSRWHGIGISAGYNDFWVDPKGEEYTELPHQYTDEQRIMYQYQPDEARKLMEAVGVDIPHKDKMWWIRTTEYGTTFPRVGDAYKGLLESSGLFDLSEEAPEYKTEYIPDVYYGAGDFDGIVWGAAQGGAGGVIHPVQTMLDDLHSQGARQHVAFQGDPSSIEGTQASDELIIKIRGSLDFDEQVALIRQWQVENALRAPVVNSGWPYGVAAFALNWPWNKNKYAYRGYLEQPEQTDLIHWWIDESLRKEILG